MNAILDADSFVFRAAAASEGDDLYVATSRVDYMINSALDEVDAKDQIVFLTGKGNFRYNVYPEYKNFRQEKARPKWEQALKQHLVDHWQAEVVHGIEGDDACGIAQCGSPKDKTIIIHQDKDINQIPGWHYNFVKRERYYVTFEEGIRFFYYQLLVGDPTDAIKGVSGIGPKKAERILQGLTSEQEYFEAVRDCYSSDEEMLLNGKCLWIWRKANDEWKFPEFAKLAE